MRQFGVFNQAFPLQSSGVRAFASARYNAPPAALVEYAVARGEARLAPGGALLADTGKHTGRSPKDKYIVAEAAVEADIWREANPAMAPEAFERLRQDMLSHLESKDLFVQDLHAGADPNYQLSIRFCTELAWHSLFIRNLMRRPDAAALSIFTPEFTVVNAPSFLADPVRHGCRSQTVVAISFERKLVLIAGTSYAGENKKAAFTLLNYLLPEQGVMPMHCAANHAVGDPEDAAIFFGLSGTGKTTLSSDPRRTLIGDDEHGWSDAGCFNFEGGCYAKAIKLSPENEPEIYGAAMRFGSVLENVAMDETTRRLDFDDATRTENTRVAYALDAAPNASATGRGGAPRNVVMLTCDSFGVMPPIARLTPAQAMYHFMSGFTAKVAGAERGVTQPEPTFSSCFGAPFMPRRPEVYGAMLRDRIATSGSCCWLLSTGWTGGAYGVGRRMPIATSRALLTAALNGELAAGAFRTDPNFGFEVPVACSDVDPALLDPRRAWADADAYDAQAKELIALFQANFAQYESTVGEDVRRVALRAA